MPLGLTSTQIATLGFAAFAVLAAPVAVRVGMDNIAPAMTDRETSRVVVARDGQMLRAFATSAGRWRLKADIGAIDQRFKAMLLAYEDQRFWHHDGVDGYALLRAAGQWMRHGRIVSGASTLTMQLARLENGLNTRTMSGKASQIALARTIDRRATKTDILTRYLTLAPYGGNIEGVRAASLAYFGKEPTRLSVAEAALLVALPQSPEARRPDRDPNAARAARDRVLDRAVETGVITPFERDAGRREPIPTRRQMPVLAAHLTAASIANTPPGAVIATTIDADLQTRLEGLARAAADRLGADISVAMLAVRSDNGDIVASIGNVYPFDRRRHGFVDMTRRPRSPGSTLKPLIYALGFDAGIAHPETLIEDRPTSFAGYRPENFDHRFRGTVRVRQALQLSLNIPAVKMLEAVGPARLVAALRRAGAAPVLSDISPPGLAIGLGGIGISLHDLVAVQAGLARGGQPVALSAVPDRSYRPMAEMVSPRAAWQVMDILAGAPVPSSAVFGRIAFKTGTSYGYRDAWAVGADGRHVIGVWVGHANGAPMPGLIGLDAAAPILFDAFARLDAITPLPGPPPGIKRQSTAELPPLLRRFERLSGGQNSSSAPVIAFPPPGAKIETDSRLGAVALKVRGGQPPYVWLVDGVPIGPAVPRKQSLYAPPGAGFVTLTVIDAAGRSDRRRVFIAPHPF